MYGAYHHISVCKDEHPPEDLPPRDAVAPDNSKDLIIKDRVFDVVGGLCENNDKFAIDRKLEPEPRLEMWWLSMTLEHMATPWVSIIMGNLDLQNICSGR